MRALLFLTLAVLVAGCDAPDGTGAGVPGETPPSVAEQAPPGTPGQPVFGNPVISYNGVGAVRLGMTAEEVHRLPNLTVERVERSLEGTPAPALQVSYSGEELLLAELQDGKIWRIRVLSDEYRTLQGARVGITAQELAAIYEGGEVQTGEGNVCAVFEKAPGMSFCFETAGADAPANWEQLVERNPKVETVLVFGEPGVQPAP